MASVDERIHRRIHVPKNTKSADSQFFLGKLHHELLLPRLRHFENVRFNGQSFIYRGLNVFPESFSDFLETGVWHHERSDFYRNPARFLKFIINSNVRHKEQVSLDEALVFTDTAVRGYYQWLSECLPRLMFALDQGYQGPVLLPWVEGSSYIEESMELLGVSFEAICLNAYASIKNLTFAPRLAPFCYQNPACLSRVREALLEAVFPNGIPQPSRKLYISRNRGKSEPPSNARGLVNEAELLKVLEKRGFEVLAPETLTLSQVIQAFAEARFVIGPHGAGIANILFMQPGGRVLEIANRFRTPITYCGMADALSLDYYYYFAEKIQGIMDDRGTHCWNFYADIDALELEIDAMLEHA